MMTQEKLVAFEEDIAERFNRAEIPYPIHLSKGNEQPLIEIFKNFQQGKDWAFNSWRSHLHALLAGVPEQKIRDSILSGRSMTLCWPEHKMFCSAIVGGVIPIALGVAWEIKRRGGDEKVWCFIGEMTAETGNANECIKYAKWNNLPIIFIIEDNGRSVCTDTKKVWGGLSYWRGRPEVIYYKWDASGWPHAGAGTRVQF